MWCSGPSIPDRPQSPPSPLTWEFFQHAMQTNIPDCFGLNLISEFAFSFFIIRLKIDGDERHRIPSAKRNHHLPTNKAESATPCRRWRPRGIGENDSRRN